MRVIISSFLPFPNISWWAQVARATVVCLDGAEHYEKMTTRNRYCVAGANGLIQLSIPLDKGRNQRAAMRDIHISNQENWQTNHWRTLTSVYRRAPYFEHYEHSLQPLFEHQYDSLTAFALASIVWLKEQAGYTFDIIFADEYIKDHGPEYVDTRYLKTVTGKENPAGLPAYYQLFADRNGFLSNLSLLDLLFSEGPYTGAWLRTHRDMLLQSQ